ncbi:aminotransferase class I/II-fold pyridoxal phosphate-dependent enzyme [Micromonospora sp. RP3T]|uniref:aminotransferase class I/II-fold pyridoxal phosphate-dependent enzyme n=1 Tax=Micromonospora sp. RP3T TaxID=2135446 RepID=UPI003D762095
MTKAVVLAAGLGTRLGGDRPKPLTPVLGIPILHRSLTNLARAGVQEVVIVIGHRAAEVVASVGDRFSGMRISYVRSERYEQTNNAYSLWLARGHLNQDVFLVEGDVVYDEDILHLLAADRRPAVAAVAPWRRGMNGTAIEMTPNGRVTRMLLGGEQRTGTLHGTYKTINITVLRTRYLRETFVPTLNRLIANGGENAYYEAVLAANVADPVAGLAAVDCGAVRWYEIDDLSDLTAANFVFGTAEDQLALLDDLHGGFWRHDFADHCLLYNLYFPPAPMLEELVADFRDTLVHYPVGHGVLQQLLSPVVRQPADRLVVANGASELIKILGRVLGRVALAVPGFNEYEAVVDEAKLHRITLRAPDFVLDVDDFFGQVHGARVHAVVITSPNNPTARAVHRGDLLRLAGLLATIGVTLVVDESFIEFGDIDQSVEPDLDDHPNIVVVKSMSKVYGVGGLRLGYLAGADLDLVSRVRAQLPIWNVNGIAEAFLRILPRFRREFDASCARVRADRDSFAEALSRIPGLEVLPSNANFIMVRLPALWSGPEVVTHLFARHRILVKHCAGKSMVDGHRYLRLGCRRRDENDRLVDALAVLLDERTPRPEPVLSGADERAAS